MPIKIEEAQATLKEYESKIFELKIELLKNSSVLLSENDMVELVVDKMKSFLLKYWEHKEKKYPNGCDNHYQIIKEKAEHIVEKYLADVVETIEMPVDETYYRLLPNSFKNVFKENPVDIYHENSDNFKLYFGLASNKEKEEIVASIHKLEEHDHNRELDMWLSQNYEELCQKMGRETIAEIAQR